MRFAFQEKPYDLVAVFVASAILAPLALSGVTGLARIALGLLFILFLPGYVLTAALFPEALDLDWIERIALSFGLSIAVVALIGLALNFTPWGMTDTGITSTDSTSARRGSSAYASNSTSFLTPVMCTASHRETYAFPPNYSLLAGWPDLLPSPLHKLKEVHRVA